MRALLKVAAVSALAMTLQMGSGKAEAAFIPPMDYYLSTVNIAVADLVSQTTIKFDAATKYNLNTQLTLAPTQTLSMAGLSTLIDASSGIINRGLFNSFGVIQGNVTNNANFNLTGETYVAGAFTADGLIDGIISKVAAGYVRPAPAPPHIPGDFQAFFDALTAAGYVANANMLFADSILFGANSSLDLSGYQAAGAGQKVVVMASKGGITLNSATSIDGLQVGQLFIDPPFTFGGQTWEIAYVQTPVPEPSTILLFGGGLAALAGMNLRRRNKAKTA